jgi:hypothetical protein
VGEQTLRREPTGSKVPAIKGARLRHAPIDVYPGSSAVTAFRIGKALSTRPVSGVADHVAGLLQIGKRRLRPSVSLTRAGL